MHTYRDAIVKARSAWILYPGTEFSFYSADGEQTAGTAGQLPHFLDGVGAIPHRPGEVATALDGVLASFLLSSDASTPPSVALLSPI